MQIPLLADTTKVISAQYGVLIEKLGIPLRGLFIINPEGVIQQITINDLPIGRSVDETLRLLQVRSRNAAHGPAGGRLGWFGLVGYHWQSMDLAEELSNQHLNFMYYRNVYNAMPWYHGSLVHFGGLHASCTALI